MAKLWLIHGTVCLTSPTWCTSMQEVDSHPKKPSKYGSREQKRTEIRNTTAWRPTKKRMASTLALARSRTHENADDQLLPEDWLIKRDATAGGAHWAKKERTFLEKVSEGKACPERSAAESNGAARRRPARTPTPLIAAFTTALLVRADTNCSTTAATRSVVFDRQALVWTGRGWYLPGHHGRWQAAVRPTD